MMLEDFFTLTEMKDGLTSLARVEELVTVMQKEKDSVMKNVGEASRQWSTVASIVAATENKGCLDLFIRLDGLWFLDRWLQEAQKCTNDTSDSFVEESTTALLGALEKLPIDKERSISSGIGVTVKNLLGHKSSRVQERARTLFDSWNQGRDNDSDHQDGEKDWACGDAVSANAKVAVKSACPEHSAIGTSPYKENASADNNVVEPSGGDILPSSRSDGSQPERVEDVKISTSHNQDASCTTLSRADKEDEFQVAPDSSIMLSPGREGLSIKEESFVRSAEGTTSSETYSCPVPVKGNVEGKSLDVPKSKGFIEDGKGKGIPDNFNMREMSSVSTTMGPQRVSSTASPANAQEPVMEPAVLSETDAKGSDFFPKNTTSFGLDNDTTTPAPELKSGVTDCGVVNHSRSTVKLKATDQGDECYPNVLQELSINRCFLRKPEDFKSSVSRMEDIGAVNDVKELSSDSNWGVGGGEHSEFAAEVSKQTMDSEYSAKIDKRRSGIELEYGIDDALEVARQVAKEVEREMKDYREPFCSSSSEKISAGGVRQPGSPDSINGEQDQLTAEPPLSEVPTGQNLSLEASSPEGDEHLMSSENMDTEPEDCIQDMGSSQVTEAAQEPAGSTEKGICSFDLNEEVHCEEMDCPTTPISTPISVVAASRAAAAPGLPVAPLQFGGALGWKGSAATSAFRPASPRKIPDGDKTLSIEGSSYSSKQRHNLLDIDLNMDGGDGGVGDPILTKQVPVSSGFHSGESSIEVSSRRGERLKFDLNRDGNNDDAPSSGWRMEGRSLYHHRNNHRSPSPALSSSSRQPSMRNINLNDSLSFDDDSYDLQPGLGKSSSQDMNIYGGFKLDDPVISIMGTRVEVNRKEFVPQTLSFLPNGQVTESAIGDNLAITGRGSLGVRPMMTSATPPPPVFGYSGLTMGSSMSLSSAVYGPGSIPYMVDSRGTHVVPQIMGSVPAVLPSYSRPPYLMSMAGLPSGLNGLEPMRPSFDLNAGLMMMEGGSRESGGLRQLFVPGQGGLMEEHTRSSAQSFSGMGMKRKEPDGGWEPYPVGYKQKPPWH